MSSRKSSAKRPAKGGRAVPCPCCATPWPPAGAPQPATCRPSTSWKSLHSCARAPLSSPRHSASPGHSAPACPATWLIRRWLCGPAPPFCSTNCRRSTARRGTRRLPSRPSWPAAPGPGEEMSPLHWIWRPMRKAVSMSGPPARNGRTGNRGHHHSPKPSPATTWHHDWYHFSESMPRTGPDRSDMHSR